jgi:hypothetical protein
MNLEILDAQSWSTHGLIPIVDFSVAGGSFRPHPTRLLPLES